MLRISTIWRHFRICNSSEERRYIHLRRINFVLGNIEFKPLGTQGLPYRPPHKIFMMRVNASCRQLKRCRKGSYHKTVEDSRTNRHPYRSFSSAISSTGMPVSFYTAISLIGLSRKLIKACSYGQTKRKVYWNSGYFWLKFLKTIVLSNSV